MSALQLRTLLEYVCDRTLRDVKFAFRGGRLFIVYVDAGGNKFNRSFDTDGTFREHDRIEIVVT